MTLRVVRDFRTRRFWRTYALHTFSAAGVIATLIEVSDIVWPDAIASSDIPVVGLAALGAIAYGTAMAWPRPIRQTYPLGNTEIRIVEGDLFDQPSNLVIGVCTTFDTETPHFISARSVQGQLLERVYSGDRSALESDLDSALAQVTPVGEIAKPGKTVVYEVGTVAALRSMRKFFFCLAYSEMNERNEARASVEGIWRSLDNLWREVRALANGDPLAIPVLGGGQARVAQVLPAQDSIRFIALSFVLASRAERVCERLDIVVRKQDAAKVDMLEIKEFLRSLRPS